MDARLRDLFWPKVDKYDSGFLPDLDERTVNTKARRCTAAHHTLRALLGEAS